jgi:hypothetical protein
MLHNPYESPKAVLEQNAPATEVPDAVMKKIRNCWVAGLISVGLTFVFTLLALSGVDVLGLDAWAFVDIAIMLGLAFGVYKKSRVCAVLLLAFFLLNKAIMWSEAGSPKGWPLTLVFLWFFAQGIVGTVQFHRAKGRRDRAESAR